MNPPIVLSIHTYWNRNRSKCCSSRHDQDLKSMSVVGRTPATEDCSWLADAHACMHAGNRTQHLSLPHTHPTHCCCRSHTPATENHFNIFHPNSSHHIHTYPSTNYHGYSYQPGLSINDSSTARPPTNKRVAFVLGVQFL